MTEAGTAAMSAGGVRAGARAAGTPRCRRMPRRRARAKASDRRSSRGSAARPCQGRVPPATRAHARRSRGGGSSPSRRGSRARGSVNGYSSAGADARNRYREPVRQEPCGERGDRNSDDAECQAARHEAKPSRRTRDRAEDDQYQQVREGPVEFDERAGGSIRPERRDERPQRQPPSPIAARPSLRLKPANGSSDSVTRRISTRSGRSRRPLGSTGSRPRSQKRSRR